MSVYIDGKLAAQKNTTVTPVLLLSPGSGTGIGIGNNTVYDFPLLGAIEEVVLYSRALSAAEVGSLVFGPCMPHQATATARLDNGLVVAATVTEGGCGYTSTPIVLIQGGGGTGATATAVVSNGVVVQVNMTDSGSGYTSTPSVYIYSPFGPGTELVKAVRPSFLELMPGTNYQMQVSADLVTWTNQGPAFKATNNSMLYPEYFDVDNWGKLFFRVQAAP
jgi:hypothetical protein